MDPRLSVLLAILIGVLVLAPHLAGIRPSSRRDWWLILVTVTFLFWLLGGFYSIRSR